MIRPLPYILTKHVIMACLALVACGCSPAFNLDEKVACRNDDDCASGRVCVFGQEPEGICTERGERVEDVGTEIDESDASDVPDGADDVSTDPQEDNQAPNAVTAEVVVGARGEAILFDASASRDPDGEIVEWFWSFGNDETGTGEFTTHTYAEAGEYDAFLVVTDDDGASTKADIRVTVREEEALEPIAQFAFDGGVIARGEEVRLVSEGSFDPDGEIVAYRWSIRPVDEEGETFVDGPSPLFVFEDVGEFEVTLAVTDNDGLIGFAQDRVRVGERPRAIARLEAEAYTGVPVFLNGSGSSDLDGEIVRYVWDITGVDVIQGERIAVAFPREDTYEVTLTVTDNDNLSARQTIQVTARGIDNAPPIADAGPDQESLVGESVAFSASNSRDPDGEIVSYTWDFGDDGSDSGENVSYTFENAGLYTVTLVVEDNQGSTNLDTVQVRVSLANQPPVAIAEPRDQDVTVGIAARFTSDTSFDPDGEIRRVLWSFGDGETSTQRNPSHVYAEDGTYQVNLIVWDDEEAQGSDVVRVVVEESIGNTAPQARIDVDEVLVVQQTSVLSGARSSDVDGSIVLYTWDFGDGVDGFGREVSHTWTQPGDYTVVLTVTDDQGAQGIAERTVSVVFPNIPPDVDIGPDIDGSVGQEISFSPLSVSDSDGTIVSYVWDFGDGGSGSTDADTSHTFTGEGIYTVRLTVTDDDGATATDTLRAAITQANTLPTADAGPDQHVELGVPTLFDGANSSDPDGTITEYIWDWGDGESDTGETAEHAWSVLGTYTVTLTVTDDRGATASDTATITVTAVNLPPVAEFTATPESATAGDNIAFDGSASSDPNGNSILSFSWDFGDDRTSSEVSPTHSYDREGIYTVRLTVTDPGGLTDTATRTVSVVCDETCYGGLFRKRYFSPEEETPVFGACDPSDTPDDPSDDYTFEITPKDCVIRVSNGSMRMTCDETTYTGTFSADGTFSVVGELEGKDPSSPIATACGASTVEETITGRYDGYDVWSGQSSVTYTFFNSLLCSPCTYDPVDVFGMRP